MNIKNNKIFKLKMHYYNIYFWGYGQEVCYHPLTKEVFNYYQENEEKLCEHILNEDNDVPDYANLTNNGELQYYDLDGIDREYFLELYSSRFTVEEVDIYDKHIQYLVDTREINETLNEKEIQVEELEADEVNEKYVLQIISSEKGTFWDCKVISENEFDFTKFKIETKLSLEGYSMITSLYYDDVELENIDTSTNGKGVDCYLLDWS